MTLACLKGQAGEYVSVEQVFARIKAELGKMAKSLVQQEAYCAR